MNINSGEAQESIDFQKYWLAFKRRWPVGLGVFSLTLASTAAFTFLQEPVFEAEGQLVFKRPSTALVNDVAEKQGAMDAISDQGSPLDTETELIRSAPVVQRVIDALKLKDEEHRPLKHKDFLRKLTVQNIAKTDLLKITYKSANAGEAATVVNRLMGFYLANSVLVNRAEAASARQFIEGQLPKTEATVRRAEVALRQFKEFSKVTDLSEEAKAAVKVSADLNGDITRVQVGLQETEAQSRAFRDQLGLSSKEALAVGTLGQSPAVQKVLEEYQQVQSQLAVQQTRYQEDHPTIQNLKSKEAALARLLRSRVEQVAGGASASSNSYQQFGVLKQKLVEDFVKLEVARLGAASRLEALVGVRDGLNKRVAALPQLEQEQRGLDRQLRAAQSTHENLLQKLQEIRVAENQKVANARVASEAAPPDEPIAPRKSQNLLVGGLLGLLLALATAFVLESLDKTLKTAKQVRATLGFAVLAAIPAFDKDGKEPESNEGNAGLIVRDIPRHPISEVFRMLRANLRFLTADGVKVIAVTSAVAQEGKSTVVANLAAAAAELGSRVLIVDADLRNPSQHQLWQLSNAVGLSNALIGQTSLDAVLSAAMDNLEVICAGVLPPNPVTLLDSKRMAESIARLRTEYDLVIIDTPPLTLAADATILGKMADGLLMVARPGVLDQASAATAKAMTDQCAQCVLGLVINGIIPANEPDSYYYYQRRYYGKTLPSTPVQTAPTQRQS